jgi:2,3-bisphosphoglycerate-independent phosphoglycerate mutase
VVSRILVILDGAPEPVRAGPTSLEAAFTPALDALCAEGTVARLRTTPEGFAPGSETGVPVLLGAEPEAPLGRGPIEAAAAGVPVPEGHGAWRVDLLHGDGRRASEDEVRRVAPALRAHLPRHEVFPLRGHRVLVVGPTRPALGRCGGLEVMVWPDGVALAPALGTEAGGDAGGPGLDASGRPVTMVCGPGAAAGIGRLLGAHVVVPHTATGDVDTDLDAKASAALLALRRGDDVVVHVAAPDEAAHRLDLEAKRAAIEDADARIFAPLRRAARAACATLAVTFDHGTCPWTGCHDADPVPLVVAGPDVPAGGPGRLTERAVAGAPVEDAPFLAGALA